MFHPRSWWFTLVKHQHSRKGDRCLKRSKDLIGLSSFNMASMTSPTVDQVVKEIRNKKKAFDPTPSIQRQFVSPFGHGEKIINSDNFVRVIQWNMLAQGLCKCNDSFILCPSKALDWSVRQNLIVEELLQYSPDVLCLQEVDHFKFLQQQLLQLGYQGSFFPKPDSPCLYTKDSNGPDGCAMFWNENRLALSHVEGFVLERDNGRNSNQVAIVGRFKISSDKSGQEFCVATTHLKAKTVNHNLRFQQGKYLEKWLTDFCTDTPLIVGGDFNAEPSEKVMKVFKDSSLDLVSSYTLLSEDGSEPPYTTWKVRGNVLGRNEEFCHTIDYLFYTPKYFACTQLLKLPSGEEIGECRLPSYSYPSDHLSLVADFQLKDRPASAT